MSISKRIDRVEGQLNGGEGEVWLSIVYDEGQDPEILKLLELSVYNAEHGTAIRTDEVNWIEVLIVPPILRQ